MFGNLEAIDADIVSNGISVQPVATVNGIARISADSGRCAQECYRCASHHNQPFHDHSRCQIFLLPIIQKAKSSLGPIWKSL